MNFDRRDEALRKRLYDRCCSDLWFLSQEVLGWKEWEKPFIPAFHRDVLDRFLAAPPSKREDGTEKRWKALLVFRGGGKTSRNVAQRIQSLLRHGHTDYSCAVFHYKAESAQKILFDVKEQLQSNELLKWIGRDQFYADPQKESPVWNQSQITVKRKRPYRVPSVVAAGMDTSLVMMHFNEIVFDDVHTDQNYLTPGERETARRFIRGTYGLWKKTSWTRGWIFGTHWHVDDAYMMFVRKDGEFFDDCDSLVLDLWPDGKEDGPSWWPEVQTVGEIARQRKQMKGLFNAQMRNKPIADGAESFKEDDVRRFDVEYVDGQEWLPPFPDRAWRVGIFVDPNASPKETADPAAVGVYARDSRGELWCVDFFHGHPGTIQLKKVIVEMARKWKPYVTGIETAGQQGQFAQEVRAEAAKAGVELKLHTYGRSGRTSKDERILDCRDFVGERRLHVGRGSKFDPLMQELGTWSPGADRDDCLDTLSDALVKLPAPPVIEVEAEEPADPYLLERILEGRKSYGRRVVCLEDVLRRS